MKVLLSVVAAVAIAVAGLLVVRVVRELAASWPVSGSPPRPEDDSRFAARLMWAPAPVAVMSLVGIAVLANSASFEEAIVGLLMTAAAMALVLQPLCSGLLFWSHHAVRMPREREAIAIERLRRAGVPSNEIWVTPTPIVVFWRLSLLTPAVRAGGRALVWERGVGAAPAGAGGLALAAHEARFWPWSVWPLGAAIALRIRDPLSLIPWWLFASVAGLIAIVAVPDLVSASRIRRAVRTDAGVREAIGGVLTFGREEATLSAGRGDGLVARWSAASAWIRAVRIAYGAARRAGLPAYLVEAASFDAVRGSRHLDDGLPAADGVRSR